MVTVNPTSNWSHQEPILDTKLYKVEYLGGSHDSFAANIVAENIVFQVDDKGHLKAVSTEIVGYNEQEALTTWQLVFCKWVAQWYSERHPT
jgi:hypothetical protein